MVMRKYDKAINKHPKCIECIPSSRTQSLNSHKEEIKVLSTLLVDFAIDPLDSLLCTAGHITKLLIGNNLFVNSLEDCRI